MKNASRKKRRVSALNANYDYILLGKTWTGEFFGLFVSSKNCLKYFDIGLFADGWVDWG